MSSLTIYILRTTFNYSIQYNNQLGYIFYHFFGYIHQNQIRKTKLSTLFIDLPKLTEITFTKSWFERGTLIRDSLIFHRKQNFGS